MNKAERLEILSRMKHHFEQDGVKIAVTEMGCDYYNPDLDACCPIGAVCPEPQKMKLEVSYLQEFAYMKDLSLRIGYKNAQFIKELWQDDGENGNFYHERNNTTTGLWQHIQLVHDDYAMKKYHQTMTTREAVQSIVRAIESAIYHVEKRKG